MVSLSPSRQRGGSTFGCLFSLLLFVAAVYYGVHIGQIYLHYYELLDAMRFQASLAQSVPDLTIVQRLSATADSLLGQTPRFTIDRRTYRNRILIHTEYTERVDLPFFKHTFVLRPRAEAPL
jgi:hypothetical protein